MPKLLPPPEPELYGAPLPAQNIPLVILTLLALITFTPRILPLGPVVCIVSAITLLMVLILPAEVIPPLACMLLIVDMFPALILPVAVVKYAAVFALAFVTIDVTKLTIAVFAATIAWLVPVIFVLIVLIVGSLPLARYVATFALP